MRRAAWLVVLAVLAASGILLWRATGARPPAPRNVIVISLDTTRADHLGCYGFPGASPTPHLDALADESVVFEHAVAPVPLTLPSHATLLTGRIPPAHGIHDNLLHALAPEHVTLAETLDAAGYATGAVIGAVVLHRIYGLDQGFDTYLDNLGTAAERRADETTRLAIDWIEAHRDEPFFLMAHYYDPHHEYDPPEPFASRHADDLYTGEIAWTDHCVGQLLEGVRELGLDETTMVVVVGDHGEMLGEHDEVSHGYFVYQGALRVPLIFRVPGRPPRRIRGVVGIVDVTPTICALLGVDASAPMEGQDLASVIGGGLPPRDRVVYCESLTPTKYDAAGLRGLVGRQWKFIETTRPELYDLLADPSEQRNVIAEQPEIADGLEMQLATLLSTQAAVRQAAADEALEARIRSLGYVGGTIHIGRDETGEDPKDLIEFHNRFSDFEHALGRGELDRAAALGAELAAQRPELANVQHGLGRIALRRGRPEEAVGYLEAALAADRAHFLAAKDLGDAFNRLGRRDDALEQWTLAVTIRPNAPQVHYSLARLHHDLGDDDRSIEHLKTAESLAPDVAAVQSALAQTYRRLGRRDEAITHYRKVLELTPDDPRHLDALARLLATAAQPTADDLQDALRMATRACEITGNRVPETLETLAIVREALSRDAGGHAGD